MKGRIIRPTQTQALGLPEIGRLRIGRKQMSSSGKEYPVSVDYFIPAGKYAELFTAVIGEKVSSIPVMFFSDDAEVSCMEEYIYRDASGARFAYGDGETFHVWNGSKYVAASVSERPDIMQKVAEICRTKDGMDNWRVTLTLRFIIPALADKILGYWQFSTQGAASSVQNIRESFDAVRALRGNVTSTVFDLSVKFAKSNKPGVNSRYPVVSLVANNTHIEAIRKMLHGGESTKNLLLD